MVTTTNPTIVLERQTDSDGFPVQPKFVGSHSLPERGTLQTVDAQLLPLLSPLEYAVKQQKTVVVLQMWQRIPCLGLLPFHLHLRWTNQTACLPLTIQCAMVPYSGAEEARAGRPLYWVDDVLDAREEARRQRGGSKDRHDSDLTVPDWEQGCRRHADEFVGEVLPGASFVCVDVVSPSGNITRGNRCSLGRYAVRNALRPSLLVPTRSGVSDTSARIFADADLLIVNAQGLRGRRSIESARRAVYARGFNRPTLIVASSPVDLLALDLKDLASKAHVFNVGDIPQVSDVAISQVGGGRTQADRQFDFAVEELRGRCGLTDHLVDLAKSAWWAARQSVNDDAFAEPEMLRFVRTLDKLSLESPEVVQSLAAGREVISQSAAEAERAVERRQAITDAVLHTGGSAGTLVVARSGGVARLRREIAEHLNLPLESLEELGVHVRSHLSSPPTETVDAAVIAGYFGLATLDAIMSSRAANIHLVFDPSESRAAWYGARKLINCFKDFGVAEPIGAMERLADGIASGVPAHLRSRAEDIELSHSFFDPCDVMPGANLRDAHAQAAPDEAIIYLTDGTRLDVSVSTRFDVLGTIGDRLKKATAIELQPGDEIVLLHEDSRTLFSERLMAALDAGKLKEAADQRSWWLLLVKSERAGRRINLSAVTKWMAELGHDVNYATVREWTSFKDDSEARVPNTRARFMAFAQCLGISLQEEALLKMFQGIRRWRISHRAAGRRLAQAIRASYLDRLDAVAQERIKREWGVSVVELVHGAHVAVVDEVILPGGVTADAS